MRADKRSPVLRNTLQPHTRAVVSLCLRTQVRLVQQRSNPCRSDLVSKGEEDYKMSRPASTSEANALVFNDRSQCLESPLHLAGLSGIDPTCDFIAEVQII